MKTLKGIETASIQTSRLNTFYYERKGEGETVLFIHGNVSSGAFWQEIMIDLPLEYRALAPDLRGYGDTEPLPVSAELGLDDMVDDIISFADALGIDKFHVAGHSMGGGIVMKLAVKIPHRMTGITLVDPMSPFGFAGTKNAQGILCCSDGAPAGAGSVSPEFVSLLAERYEKDDKQMAPVNVFRSFYIKPPFIPENEDLFLQSMLSTRVGDDWYPGDFSASGNWPGAAPGGRGVANAFAGTNFNASSFSEIEPRPPVLWIRGAEDQIVSNNSLFDISALGAMGAVPGWPGAELCPPQPMIDQTRYVLEKYSANGGSYREEIITDAGHSPFIDRKDDFEKLFFPFLK
ncbi:MAG: alpha/beta hydrolase [Spirochaetales bacterium]|nr:alpha/beta hydrolase [Spirochaetales bacterium]